MFWLKANIKDVSHKVRDKINEVLEMPIESVSNSLRISMINNEYIFIEGKSKVADYYDNYIKVKTDRYTIAVDGKNLSINEISDVDLIISGNIMNISYI